MDDPQGAKEAASTQYIFHVQDGTGLVTRLEAVGPDGARRDVALPYPMTLHVPPPDNPAARPQPSAEHGHPHFGEPQGTFLWSEMAGAPRGQPTAPGTAMGPQPGSPSGPTPGPQFGTAQGPAPGTHFAGPHGPHVAPAPGRTVQLQFTPPGLGHTVMLHPGAPLGTAALGPAMAAYPGQASGPVMNPGHGRVSGPPMGLYPGHAPGTALASHPGHAPGTAMGPQFNEGGPRT